MRKRSSRSTRVRLGDWWIIDDISGFKVPHSETRILSGDEKGLVVHTSQYETPNPQLYIRGVPDDQSVTPTRPEPPENFVAVPYGGWLLGVNGAPLLGTNGVALLTENTV